jgi:hypothetical protein
MSAPDYIVTKIKYLLKLTQSSNSFEAENARTLADKLIAKYNLDESILSSEDKPLYSENDKLFHSYFIEGWKSKLALSIGLKFDCQIVQETLVPTEGSQEYYYYLYGDPEDVEKVKFTFNSFINKIDSLVLQNCYGRGQIYISSYCEGLVQSIKTNIEQEDLVIPETKSRNISEIANPTKEAILKPKFKKEKPAETSVDVNSQSLIKNIIAYFRGIDDGKDIYLQEILELEAEIKLNQLNG